MRVQRVRSAPRWDSAVYPKRYPVITVENKYPTPSSLLGALPGTSGSAPESTRAD